MDRIIATVVLCAVLLTCLTTSEGNDLEKTMTSKEDMEMCKKANESCAKCTQSEKCYWCDPLKKCAAYLDGDIIHKDCPDKKWYWKQCVLPGNLLIIIVPTVVGVVIILACLCVYCCCCKRYKKWQNKRMDKEDAKTKRKKEERLALQAQKNTERQAKRDAIRDKYGLSGSGSKYERLPADDDE